MDSIGSFSFDRFEKVLRSTPYKGPFFELRFPPRPKTNRGNIVASPTPLETMPPSPSMTFFTEKYPPLGVIPGGFHEILNNPERFYLKYIQGESQSVEEHSQVFKDVVMRAQIEHQDPTS